MRKKYILAGAAVAAAAIVGVQFLPHYKPTPPVIYSAGMGTCDASLWRHVYAGDPRKFRAPQDRLKIIKECLTVEGTLVTAKAEKDGDWHLTLDVADKTLLNDKNVSGQHGYLVLEPVCSNLITQKDTLAEHVCDNFQQKIFTKDMLGKRVRVVGVYVTDMEHGWREIHPISALEVIN